MLWYVVQQVDTLLFFQTMRRLIFPWVTFTLCAQLPATVLLETWFALKLLVPGGVTSSGISIFRASEFRASELQSFIVSEFQVFMVSFQNLNRVSEFQIFMVFRVLKCQTLNPFSYRVLFCPISALIVCSILLFLCSLNVCSILLLAVPALLTFKMLPFSIWTLFHY